MTTRKAPAKTPKTTVTGSGTAVMSSLQLTSPFSIPLVLLSHRTKAQVLFGARRRSSAREYPYPSPGSGSGRKVALCSLGERACRFVSEPHPRYPLAPHEPTARRRRRCRLSWRESGSEDSRTAVEPRPRSYMGVLAGEDAYFVNGGSESLRKGPIPRASRYSRVQRIDRLLTVAEARSLAGGGGNARLSASGRRDRWPAQTRLPMRSGRWQWRTSSARPPNGY